MLQDAKIEVIQGTAEILGPKRIRVGSNEMTCERLLIATRGRPAHAPISGLESALTSDDILHLRVVPKRLAVIGAGYIGIVGLELTSAKTIPVNSYSETSIPGVSAIGDVTNRKKLTPVAIAERRAFAATVFGGLDIPFHDD